MNTEVLFSGWSPLVRTFVVAICAYVALVLLLRISGKRTLAQMNAFDLVVTVALGSTLASIITSKDVALAEGVLALALLIALQFSITWLSVRSSRVRKLVRSEPALLAYQGRPLDTVLHHERVTRQELDSAVRAAGLGGLSAVGAVVLETDGTFSVIACDALASKDLLSIVSAPEAPSDRAAHQDATVHG